MDEPELVASGSLLTWVDAGIEHSMPLHFGLTRDRALEIARSVK